MGHKGGQTVVNDTESRRTAAPSAASGARWKWVAAVAALGAVMATSATAFAVSRGTDNSPSPDSPRIAATQSTCQQWLDDNATSPGTMPDEGWCDGMGDWMHDQMANGSMMGNTMGSHAMVQACQRWLEESTTSTEAVPDQGWCDGMGDWMYDQMANGSMMGTTIWGSPEAMLNACVQWTTASPGSDTPATGATTSATAWCEQMVTWMSQHMGQWDDWDGHMGDGPSNSMMNR